MISLIDEPTEEEIRDACKWARDYCARETATQIALPGLSEQQLNRIEGIWATTIQSAYAIEDQLMRWNMFDGEERIRANAYVWIRLGPTNNPNNF